MSFLQNAAQKRSNNGSGFEIEVIQTLEALHTVVRQWWQFLQDNVDGNSLENDPTYIQLRLETQESGSPFLEGTLSPWIILLRRSGRIRCIAPFSLQNGRYNVTFGEATLVSLSSPILKLFGAISSWLKVKIAMRATMPCSACCGSIGRVSDSFPLPWPNLRVP